jgi:hypothetical protein
MVVFIDFYLEMNRCRATTPGGYRVDRMSLGNRKWYKDNKRKQCGKAKAESSY